jgi:N-acyl homoserine lactone hydrolase
MSKSSSRSPLLFSLALLAAAPGVGGCLATTHPASTAALGVARPSAELERLVEVPGPVAVETVISADWEVPRAGLLNLEHPEARAAGLKDGPEPIHLAFHAIQHPERGLYLVDTGMEKAQQDDPERATIQAPVSWAMNTAKLRIRVPTATWLARQPSPPMGVFLTHLHLDHVTGMRDVPASAVVFAGPGEPDERAFLHLFTQGVIDDELAGKGALQQWRFQPERDGAFEAVLDVFGDGTVWALLVPGHTPGSTAYLIRTPQGPVLLVGDACHTAWGWEHGVEPGTFSHDKVASARSLARLRAFVQRHPGVSVRLGHQQLPAATP